MTRGGALARVDGVRESLLAIALLGAACRGPAPLEGPLEPGVSGGALSGRLEVVAIDELTREPIEASVTVAPDGLAAATGSSPFVHESAQPFERADVTVIAGVARVRWVGVRGARVVIPVPRRETREVAVELRGTAPSGASAIELTSLAPLHVLRSGGVGGAATACAPVDACASLEVPEGARGLVASVLDADGVPLAFAVGEVGAAIDLDAAREAIAVEAGLPDAPPGLDAVVGVPGLTRARELARLPAARGFTFVVPGPDAGTADASFWILARAQGTDRSSTVVQRGLREASDAGEWPAWLETPSLTPLDGALFAVPPAGATLLVVERTEADVEELTLYLEPPADLEIAPAASVVVRAVDGGRLDAGALDLDAFEDAAVRWSEAVAR